VIDLTWRDVMVGGGRMVRAIRPDNSYGYCCTEKGCNVGAGLGWMLYHQADIDGDFWSGFYLCDRCARKYGIPW